MKWYDVHYLVEESLTPLTLHAMVYAGNGQEAERFFHVFHPHGMSATHYVALLYPGVHP